MNDDEVDDDNKDVYVEHEKFMWEIGSFNHSLTVQMNIIRLNFSGVLRAK